MIWLTDDFGIPIKTNDIHIANAASYFDQIIKHLNRKKPALGSCSGHIYPNSCDSADPYIYRPRISLEIYQLQNEGKIDLLLHACYAYHSLSIRYSENGGFSARYEILIEKRAVIHGELGISQYSSTVQTQEEVIDEIRYRLRKDE